MSASLLHRTYSIGIHLHCVSRKYPVVPLFCLINCGPNAKSIRFHIHDYIINVSILHINQCNKLVDQAQYRHNAINQPIRPFNSIDIIQSLEMNCGGWWVGWLGNVPKPKTKYFEIIMKIRLLGPIPETICSRSAQIRSCYPDRPIAFHKPRSRSAHQIEKIRNKTVYC